MVVNELTAEATLDRICTIALRLTGCDRCTIVAMGGGSQLLSERTFEGINLVRNGTLSLSTHHRDSYLSHASVPIMDASGRHLATLNIMDRSARRYGPTDMALLEDLAQLAGEHLRLVNDAQRYQQAERQIREQASLLDHSHDAIMVRDMEGRVRYWNRAAERTYGWSAGEALGRNLKDLIYGDNHGGFEEAQRELHLTGSWKGLRHQVHRSGRPIIVDISVSLVRSDDGESQSVFSINTDVTDRVELEERLAQSQKLDSVGQLTAGVAHDFNNLLTVIIGTADLLQQDLTDHPQQLELAQAIRSTGERAALLTNRLLAFGRRQSLSPSVMATASAVDDLRTLLRSTLREDIDLVVTHHDELWDTYVDRAQFDAALVNLCINARDAMAQGGCIAIDTANVDIGSPPPPELPDARPGSYVRIALADTGHGMSSEVALLAFDPFFTTKEAGKGSGLGLSMVYGFIKQSGGHIRIASEPCKGTTVTMYLPRARSAC